MQPTQRTPPQLDYVETGGRAQRFGPADVPSASAVLARAFCDDPPLVRVFEGDTRAKRLRGLHACMRGFVRATQHYGQVEVVRRESGAICSVALAYPPGGYPVPMLAQRFIARGPLRCGPRRLLRFARLDSALAAHHPTEPHWYLWFLGVEPDCQGRGLGSQLLHSLHARADMTGVGCYLETAKPQNVLLYQRHGYQVIGSTNVPGLDVEMWFMRRPRTRLGVARSQSL